MKVNELMDALDRARRQQMPGYPEFASRARADALPNSAEAAAMSGVPIVAEAGETALIADAARRGKWGDVGWGLAGLALPFVAGPALKKGATMLGERAVEGLPTLPVDPNMSGSDVALGGALGRPGTLGDMAILAGPGARQPPVSAVTKAARLQGEGLSQEEIWRQTGIWLPMEGGLNPMQAKGSPDFRFEIPEPEGARIPERFGASPQLMQNEMNYRAAATVADLVEKQKLEPDQALDRFLRGFVYARGDRLPPEKFAAAVEKAGIDPAEVQRIVSSDPRDAIIRRRDELTRDIRNARTMPAKEAFPSPELFQQYPELADVPVMLKTNTDMGGASAVPGHDYELGARGAWNPRDRTIYLNEDVWARNPDETFGVLAHELQHGVQQQEPGWSQGTSPGMAPSRMREAMQTELTQVWSMPGLSMDERRALEEAVKARYAGTSKLEDYQKYKHTYGESEARGAQARAQVSQAMRRAMGPWNDVYSDVDPNKVFP